MEPIKQRLCRAPALASALAQIGLGLLLLCPLPALAQTVSLQEAVAAAEQNNLDLQLVAGQSFLAQNRVGQAWSLVGPKVQVNANYTINKDEIVLDFTEQIPEEFEDFFADSEPTVIQAKSYADANASIVQPIFSAESLPLLRGAYAARDAQELTEQSVRLQVEEAAAQTYYGVVVTRRAQQIAEAARDNAQKHLDLALRQVEVGAAPPIAAKQAELALSRAERGVQAAQERRVNAEQMFTVVTGLSAEVEVAMPLPPSVSVSSVDQALERARSQRPDLQAAALTLRAAQFQHQADLVSWLPDVQARLTGTWTQNLGFQGEPTWWLFVVSANWTLWDGGYRVATNRATGAQVELADLSAQRTLLMAEQEVRMAWEALQRSEAALAAVERELTLAKDTLRMAEMGFEAGQTTWLEVEDASLGATATELSLLTERMSRDLAAIRLSVAMGELDL